MELTLNRKTRSNVSTIGELSIDSVGNSKLAFNSLFSKFRAASKSEKIFMTSQQAFGKKLLVPPKSLFDKERGSKHI